MAFWTGVAGANDPKRDFRFVLTISDIAGKLDTMWMAKKVDRPSFQISESEHKFLNHSFFYPGKVTWQDVTCTVVDPGGDTDIMDGIADMLTRSGYAVPNTAGNLTSISKSKAMAALGTVTIHVIGADHNVSDESQAEPQILESWTLQQAWVKEFKPSSMDYDGDNLSTIDITFKYDWATLNADASGSPSKYWSVSG